MKNNSKYVIMDRYIVEANTNALSSNAFQVRYKADGHNIVVAEVPNVLQNSKEVAEFIASNMNNNTRNRVDEGNIRLR